MLCPMCRSTNVTVNDGITATLFICRDCGYSRSHRTVNLFVELWMDWCEFQGTAHEGKLPANEQELTALQQA